jgi:AmpD protein
MNHAVTAAQTALWCGGWYRYAHRKPSPNFGKRPDSRTIDLIVIHSISLPPGQFGGNEVLDFFANALDCDAHPYFNQLRGVEVSAHFFIRRNGDLYQLVDCDLRAWHAGASHYLGQDNCNDNSIGIELEGIEGGDFEMVQIETLTSLCAALPQRYRINHIAGHEHVAPLRKMDPGAGFDWRLLQESLAWPHQCFPEDVLTPRQK